jgi:long-chain acyl-CoA synthetase
MPDHEGAPPTMADDFLTAYAAAIGDKLAVVDDRPDGWVRSLTFAELNVYANRLANGMLDLGVRPGDKIVWCGQNSLPIIVLTHAARKIGLTAVPVNYRLSDDEATYVTDNSDSVLAFVDAAYARLFERIRPATPRLRDVVVFDGDPLDGQRAEADVLGTDTEPSYEGDPGASMIYTSGTTGRPKGVSRKGVGDPSQVQALIAHIGYRPDDVYITTGPLYHSGPGGFAGIAAVLSNTVVLQHRFDPEDWLRLVDRYGVSSTFSAPTPIRMICNVADDVFARYDVSTMRIMVANAAPWSHALKLAYLDHFPPESLWEVYGSTEMGVNTVLAPADQLRKVGSCGLPAPGVEVLLLDEEGNVVTEPNQPGELFVRSASVFDTYYKAQEKYDEEHRGDLHTVGDIAYRDEEGYLFICDRKKDMIISGGMNVYPAEIESALELHPDIFDVAVFGIPSEEWGESVHAVVVAVAGATLDEAAVVAYAREHLASYKIPRSVSFTDELPRTGSGKILKRELRQPYWEGRGVAVN